jgi:hypothetical protein
MWRKPHTVLTPHNYHAAFFLNELPILRPFGVALFFFFQKKKQKALFRFVEDFWLPKPRRSRPRESGACPQQNSALSGFLLFQKRSKSVSSASQKIIGYPNLGEANPGGLGAYPQQNSTLSGFLFQKRSKSVSSASQKIIGYPDLGEADPGGLGACPQQDIPQNSMHNLIQQLQYGWPDVHMHLPSCGVFPFIYTHNELTHRVRATLNPTYIKLIRRNVPYWAIKCV